MLQNRLFSLWRRDPSGCGATISDAIARSSLVFCNSVSADRIGMAASRSFEGSLARNAFLALVIFLLKILLKSASKSSFFRSGVGFGATISDAVARSSIVFCNSVSADRIVMAVSRLLHAVAACVILLSFAAGLRKSYWSGCMKAATVICQQIFSILALVIFLLKILLKSASKSSFFAQASRSGFGATISDAIARSSLVFCNSVSADRIGMAASRLLLALAACVMSFAAGSRTSSWTGCMKAAKWIC